MRYGVLGAGIVIASLVGCSASEAPPAPDQAAEGPAAVADRNIGGDDLSGVWTNDPPQSTRSFQNFAFSEELPPMTPWAMARYEQAKPTFGPRGVMVTETNDPVYKCFPPGVPRVYFHPFPMEIIQQGGRVLMIFEYDHTIRQIYTDGRGHRDDLAASWTGDSIGHWEGKTLAVETTNFNDKTWLDRRGVPHSDQLRVLERFHRSDEDHMEVDITVEDPVAFTKPWTGKRYFKRVDWNIEEFVCQERNQGAGFQKFEEQLLNYDKDDAQQDER
jgi:hypothetical protein